MSRCARRSCARRRSASSRDARDVRVREHGVDLRPGGRRARAGAGRAALLRRRGGRRRRADRRLHARQRLARAVARAAEGRRLRARPSARGSRRRTSRRSTSQARGRSRRGTRGSAPAISSSLRRSRSACRRRRSTASARCGRLRQQRHQRVEHESSRRDALRARDLECGARALVGESESADRSTSCRPAWPARSDRRRSTCPADASVMTAFWQTDHARRARCVKLSSVHSLLLLKRLDLLLQRRDLLLELRLNCAAVGPACFAALACVAGTASTSAASVECDDLLHRATPPRM